MPRKAKHTLAAYLDLVADADSLSIVVLFLGHVTPPWITEVFKL